MDSAINIKTIICDIDGVIFRHPLSITEIKDISPCNDILPGVLGKFQEWNHKGYHILLVTGRPESLRETTEKQLNEAGLFYNQLIMSLPRGERVIINDAKPTSNKKTTRSITVKRNDGLADIVC